MAKPILAPKPLKIGDTIGVFRFYSLLLGKIDEKTYQFYNVFYECSSCHRIYWEGSHYKNLQKEIKKLQEILSSQNPGHNGD